MQNYLSRVPTCVCDKEIKIRILHLCHSDLWNFFVFFISIQYKNMESMKMNRKRRKTSNQQEKMNLKKVIRCSLLMRPVLEQETCSKFIKGGDQETNNCCKNCKYSF